MNLIVAIFCFALVRIDGNNVKSVTSGIITPKSLRIVVETCLKLSKTKKRLNSSLSLWSLRRGRDSGLILARFLPLIYVPHTANNTLHDGISGEIICLFTFSIFAYYSIVLTSVQLFSGKNAPKTLIFTHL